MAVCFRGTICMYNPKISVIVPVYNVEKYLRKCIKSIINQTLKEFEMILIDDGSTDSCGNICDEFAIKDERICVIHKENGGLMSAWMKGLEKANTDNIVFVDSDDWIGPRMFEVLLREKNKYQADMIICNMRRVEKGKECRENFIIETGYYNEEKLKNKLYPVMLNAGDFQLRGCPVSRWGKLIKKELLQNNLKYCDTWISFAEDLNIIFPTLLDCKSLVVVDDKEADYYYRLNPSSILHSYNKTMYQQAQIVYKKLFQVLEEKEKGIFEQQLMADYLAAIVQCFKNELMAPKKFSDVKYNIGFLCKDALFIKASSKVNWSRYRKLNVLIIYIMNHWNILTKNFLTFPLYCMKRYKMSKLKD